MYSLLFVLSGRFSGGPLNQQCQDFFFALRRSDHRTCSHRRPWLRCLGCLLLSLLASASRNGPAVMPCNSLSWPSFPHLQLVRTTAAVARDCRLCRNHGGDLGFLQDLINPSACNSGELFISEYALCTQWQCVLRTCLLGIAIFEVIIVCPDLEIWMGLWSYQYGMNSILQGREAGLLFVLTMMVYRSLASREERP